MEAQDGAAQLLRFEGKLAANTAVGVTFSIFKEEYGGTALWSETQTVQPGLNGAYNVLLGAATNRGVPVSIFSSGESRWLAVEIPGQAPLPRVLMVSVPYALKAADADSLGGIPASAFLLAAASGSGANGTTREVTADKASGPASVTSLTTASPVNYLPKYVGSSTFSPSSVYDNGTSVSVGGIADLGAVTFVGNVPFGDTAGIALFNEGGGANASVSLDFYNTIVNSGIPQAKLKALDDGNYSDHLTFWTKTPGAPGNAAIERMRLTSAGNLGIGISNPVRSLEVSGIGKFYSGIMFSNGTTQTTMPTLTGGGSNLTVINPGTGLAGGGAGGALTLNIDTSKVPLLTSSNAFLGSQSVTGVLSANGSIQLPGGSAASPALSFNGSGSTGLFSPSANALGISAAGVSGLTATSAGNLDAPGSLFKSGTYFLHNVGVGNTALGIGAHQPPFSATNNVAVGLSSLLDISNGSNNVAVGFSSLINNTSGGDDVAIGPNALVNASTASNYNLALGSDGMAGPAGTNIATNSVSDVLLENPGVANESNTMRIGSSCCQLRTFIAGISGVTTGLTNAVPVMIDANGQLGTVNSSRRFKENIQDMNEMSQGLLRLRPVTYRYKQPYADGSRPIEYGLIAEEVERVFPDLVARSTDGQIQTVQYQKLTPMLLNEVQHHNSRIAEFTQRLNEEERANAAQKDALYNMEKRLAALESVIRQVTKHESSK
jgi:hypothetical protein